VRPAQTIAEKGFAWLLSLTGWKNCAGLLAATYRSNIVGQPVILSHSNKRGRIVLHVGHVDDMTFIFQALLFEAQSNAARGARAPTVVKYHHEFSLLPACLGSNALRARISPATSVLTNQGQ
jgi:hypothetical protein